MCIKIKATPDKDKIQVLLFFLDEIKADILNACLHCAARECYDCDYFKISMKIGHKLDKENK